MSNSQDSKSQKNNLISRPQASPPPVAKRGRRPAPSHPKSEEAAVSPAFVLWVLGQWWKIALPVGVVFAVIAAAAVWFTYEPEFEAKALIVIEQSVPYIAFNEGHVSSGATSDRFIQTQLELLRSSVVLGPVMARSEVARLDELKQAVDPQKDLEKHLTIRQVGKSQLYEVKYVSTSAQAASEVANAVVSVYLEIQSDEQFKHAQRVIDILEEERGRRSNEVDRLRDRVVELAKEVTGKDPFGHGMVTDVEKSFAPITGLYQSLTEVEVEREVLMATIQALEDAAASIPDQPVENEDVIDLQLVNHPEVREQQAMLEQIVDGMDYLKGRVVDWEHHEGYTELQENLDQESENLAELKQILREELGKSRLDMSTFEREQEIAALKTQLALLDTRNKSLQNRYTKHLQELQAGGEKSVLLEFTRAELIREEKVFELIAARRLALQTEMRAPARVRLRLAAAVPSIPIAPIPYRMLFLACSVAALCPLGLAVVREMTVRRISDSEQLGRESKLRVLGEVTRFPMRPVAGSTHKLSRRAQREMFIFAESIDSLRTSLVLSEELRSSSVMVITSATSGEGKTSVTTSLMASIASASGKPTLIIDADLRSPDVANVLGVKSQPGLAEVLMGDCSLQDAIQPGSNANTHILSAGRAKVNPHHLVESGRVQEMLDKLRKEFSTILIDTPPVLGASESLVFAKLADSVVYCSLRNVSRVRQVRVAVERLEHAGANLVGAILSGTPTQHYANVYGYYSSEHQEST